MRIPTGPARVGDIVFRQGDGEGHVVGRVVADNDIEILATDLSRAEARDIACKQADAATAVIEISCEHPDGVWTDCGRRGGLDRA